MVSFSSFKRVEDAALGVLSAGLVGMMALPLLKSHRGERMLLCYLWSVNVSLSVQVWLEICFMAGVRFVVVVRMDGR